MSNPGPFRTNSKRIQDTDWFSREELIRMVMALDSPLRWDIISGIGREVKATSEIREALVGMGRRLSRSGLYYHLSALESAGIIERASYREIGGGAPEKVWRVKVPKITVEILKPE